jgi:hypothetical protein
MCPASSSVLRNGSTPAAEWARVSRTPVNGSRPVWSSQASHTTMIPIDSYQDARLVSYVVLIRSTSPALTCGRQF